MNNLYADMRLPPHSTAAEQSVLGGIMLDNEAWTKVEGYLAVDDFYREDHRRIYKAMTELQSANKPLDLIVLSDYLRDKNLLEDIGGLSYLATLAKDTPSAANISAYVDIVRDKSNLRQFIKLTTEALELAYRAQGEKAERLIADHEQAIFQLSEKTTTAKNDVVRIRPALKELVEHMQTLASMPVDTLLGTSSGLSSLDSATDGLQKGDLVILAARPSMGKSTLAADWERAVSGAQGAVLSFTLEMPIKQLMMRHVSALSGVPLSRVKKTMTFSEDDWSLVANKAFKPLADRPLYYVNKPGISIGEIVAYARRIHREHQQQTGAGLRLITIDYIQLMSTSHSGNRAEDLGEISRRLKQLALELDCTIVALSQLNRNVEQRPNKRPVMSDLRESGALEQDADVIMFIYRDEVYNPDTADKGTAEIIISKNRNGELGNVRVLAELDRVRFRDYSPDQWGGQYA